jgi:hypothetical protein
MATTIMSSTRVNARLLLILRNILSVSCLKDAIDGVTVAAPEHRRLFALFDWAALLTGLWLSLNAADMPVKLTGAFPRTLTPNVPETQ